MPATLDPELLDTLRTLARRALDEPGRGAVDELAFELTVHGLDGAPDDDEAPVDTRHDDALARLVSLRERRAELREHAGKQARATIEATAAALFAEFAQLESFGWRQGTPTAVESSDQPGLMIAHTDNPFINGVEYGSSPDDQTLFSPWARVVGLLDRFPAAVLKAAFGDGYHITLHRDGTVQRDHWWPDDSW